jgi:hypothetical protein
MSERAKDPESFVKVEERDQILKSARLFMYANLKVDLGEMERIANVGPVDMLRDVCKRWRPGPQIPKLVCYIENGPNCPGHKYDRDSVL